MTDQIVNVVGQINADSIKAFAIATPARSPALPNVPTTKEAGLPNYEVSAWNAIFAPKGTPEAIVKQLSDALDKALDDPNARKRLDDLGGVIPARSRARPCSPAEAGRERSGALDACSQGSDGGGQEVSRWRAKFTGGGLRPAVFVWRAACASIKSRREETS